MSANIVPVLLSLITPTPPPESAPAARRSSGRRFGEKRVCCAPAAPLTEPDAVYRLALMLEFEREVFFTDEAQRQRLDFFAESGRCNGLAPHFLVQHLHQFDLAALGFEQFSDVDRLVSVVRRVARTGRPGGRMVMVRCQHLQPQPSGGRDTLETFTLETFIAVVDRDQYTGGRQARRLISEQSFAIELPESS